MNYSELKHSCNQIKQKDNQVEELIKLDVQRSFHNHENTISHMVQFYINIFFNFFVLIISTFFLGSFFTDR